MDTSSRAHPLLRSLFDQKRSLDIYVVGGAVRDRLLKRDVWDVDLIVPTNSKEWAEVAAQVWGARTFLLDESTQVYRVIDKSGVQFDFGNFQAKSFEDDLDRRDYTINAMAVPLQDWLSSHWQKKVVDRHHGLSDLRLKKLRAVSKQMISADPLRILRAFRIAAELGFSMDSATLSLIKSKKSLAKKPSGERLRDEFLKLFATAQATPQLLLMEKTGVLATLIPDVIRLKKTAPRYYGPGGVLKHSLDSVFYFEQIQSKIKSWFPKCWQKIVAYLEERKGGYPRFAHLKWATLLHDIGKPQTAKVIKGRLRFFEHEYVGAKKIPKLAPRFRWSKEETQSYRRLVENHMRPGNLAAQKLVTNKAYFRFFRDLGEDAVGMLLVSLADHLTYLTPRQRKKRSSPHEKITIKMMNLYYQDRAAVLPPRLLNGTDVMKALNLKPSPVIGTLLNELAEAQAEGRIKTKEEALAYLKSNLAQVVANTPASS